MGIKLLHLHLHGLIRAKDLELGRDPDTGGQTLYVLELVKALAASSQVQNVQLVTRQIFDRRISSDYSEASENIIPGAEIIRIPFGPKRYIRKELLWPYLDDFAERLIYKLEHQSQLPDWIHAHYADAGYVGSIVSKRLGIPLIFSGHSLGKEKKRRLLQSGMDHEQIENTYSISRRIDAEELALSSADLVITSTAQESNSQYSRYANFISKNAKVIPPGVDLSRFNSNEKQSEDSNIRESLNPFLRQPDLPPLLAISRAVRRKNIPALVEAFGRSSLLRNNHNLVLVLGNRDDIRQLDKQQKEIFQQIFELIDRYELYGKIAIPKSHRRSQIPAIYRWASKRNGLFVNPALTEPFGLTLLEASACGLPIVATDDGGPSEILSKCENGLLVDVTDLNSLKVALEQGFSNEFLWQKWKQNGINAVESSFSWNAHVHKYLHCIEDKLNTLKHRSLAEVIHLSDIRAS